MIVGQRVIVWTASGTFMRKPGVVTSVMRGGAMVHVEGERTPLFFSGNEIVPVSEREHLAGAE